MSIVEKKNRPHTRMKESNLAILLLGFILAIGIVFFMMNKDLKKKDLKEKFVTYAMPLFQDSPQKVYYDEQINVGLGNCAAGNSGCTFYPSGVSQNIDKFFEWLIKTVPAGYGWVITGTGPILVKLPFNGGKIITANDLKNFSKEHISYMLNVNMCKVYNVCVDPPSASSQAATSSDKCNTSPVSLDCLRKMFLRAGCNERGAAYPTLQNYAMMSQMPYEQLQMGLTMFQTLKHSDDPQIKATVDFFCLGVQPPVAKYPPEIIKPAPSTSNINCMVNDKQEPLDITCVKTTLHDMYLGSASPVSGQASSYTQQFTQ